MFGAVDSAAESTNMSLSIGFSLKIAFFTSMALYFHFFQKNNIKACCTDSLLKAVGSVSSLLTTSYNQLFTINVYFRKCPPNRYTCLVSVFSFFKHIFLQRDLNTQPLRPVWLIWLNGLRTKWLWVRVSLQPLTSQISRLFRVSSSLKFRKLECRFTLNPNLTW